MQIQYHLIILFYYLQSISDVINFDKAFKENFTKNLERNIDDNSNNLSPIDKVNSGVFSTKHPVKFTKNLNFKNNKSNVETVADESIINEQRTLMPIAYYEDYFKKMYINAPQNVQIQDKPNNDKTNKLIQDKLTSILESNKFDRPTRLFEMNEDIMWSYMKIFSQIISIIEIEFEEGEKQIQVNHEFGSMIQHFRNLMIRIHHMTEYEQQYDFPKFEVIFKEIYTAFDKIQRKLMRYTLVAFTENENQPFLLSLIDSLLQIHNRNQQELMGLRRQLKQQLMKIKAQISIFLTGNSALLLKLINQKKNNNYQDANINTKGRFKNKIKRNKNRNKPLYSTQQYRFNQMNLDEDEKTKSTIEKENAQKHFQQKNLTYNWHKTQTESKGKLVGSKYFGRSLDQFISRDLEIIIGNFITKHIEDLYEIALVAFLESYLKSFYQVHFMNKFSSVLDRLNAFDTNDENLRQLIGNIRMNTHQIKKNQRYYIYVRPEKLLDMYNQNALTLLQRAQSTSMVNSKVFIDGVTFESQQDELDAYFTFNDDEKINIENLIASLKDKNKESTRDYEQSGKNANWDELYLPSSQKDVSSQMMAYLYTKWTAMRLINREPFKWAQDLELLQPMILIKTKNTMHIFTDSRIRMMVNKDNTSKFDGVDSVYESLDMTMQDMEDTAKNQLQYLIDGWEEDKTPNPDKKILEFKKQIGEFDKSYVTRVDLEKEINNIQNLEKYQ